MVNLMKIHYQEIKTKTSVLKYIGINVLEKLHNRKISITDRRVNLEVYDYDYLIKNINYFCKLYEVENIYFVNSKKHEEILKKYCEKIFNDSRIKVDVVKHHPKKV